MTTPTRPVRGTTDLDIVRAALEEEYDVLGELGRGGMAIVYKARERKLDRDVAIKVLPFTLAFDESLVERFTREARTAARLEHPHIIPIYRVGQEEQVTYFVMKLLRGQSLSDRLLERGPLSPAETRRVLAETASALGYAHRHGVVHRDVKPDNILLDEDGRCVVTDFGIARSGAESKLTATGMSVGTPRYMSPEQARAKEVDGRSDLYSLGIVGYECLTGRLPFDGDDMLEILMAHISKPVRRPALPTAEARSLYAIIERMLAKAPEDRFATGEELAAALKGELAVTPVRASAPLYGSVNEPPRSAAALDRALEAGFAMLKQQRPRVDAGIAAGKRAIEAHAPRVRSAGGRMLDMAAHACASVYAFVARASAQAYTHGKRFAAIGAAVATIVLVGYYSIHFALLHRSRCPSVAAVPSSSASTAPSGGDGGGATPAKPRSFSLLVDDGGSIRRGSSAQVYYDVCGLPPGATFTTRVTITKSESGLKRLLGSSVEPVTEKFDETAGGPRERKHRSIAMDGMPGGSYWITVVVTDDKGRRREEGASLRVRGE